MMWCCTLLIFAAMLGRPAWAAGETPVWDAKRVEKVATDLKAGKPVAETGTLAKGEAQVLTIVVSENLTYVIDYRAKVCFASQGGAQPLAFVPCQALKRGYPVLAPLLEGNEGMNRRQLPPSMMRRENAPGAAPRPGGPPQRPAGPPPRQQ
jgi:hypothetical protein